MNLSAGTEQNKTKTVLQTLLLVTIVVLAAIGILAATMRTTSVVTGGLTYTQITQIMPARLVDEGYLFDRWFLNYPVLTLLHVIPGGIFLAAAPFQLSSRIRSRYTSLHRLAGRVLILTAVLVGVSGLVLASLFPYGGPVAAAAAFTAGFLFLIALSRALIAIRRGNFLCHREWMIRMFALGLGIATVRVVGLILGVTTQRSFEESAGTAFWTGWIISFALAEWWIRYTRPRRESVGDLQVQKVEA